MLSSFFLCWSLCASCTAALFSFLFDLMFSYFLYNDLHVQATALHCPSSICWFCILDDLHVSKHVFLLLYIFSACFFKHVYCISRLLQSIDDFFFLNCFRHAGYSCIRFSLVEMLFFAFLKYDCVFLVVFSLKHLNILCKYESYSNNHFNNSICSMFGQDETDQ